MPTIRIPTPLRQFTGGQAEVSAAGTTVGEALLDLTAQHPSLRQHLYGDSGELRSFVNVFLNQSDIRELQGAGTALKEDDRLMIVPSIAGGSAAALPKVDHSALRANQSFIIGLLLLAFVFNLAWLVVGVAAVMLVGTLVLRGPGFGPLYRRALKPLGWVKPDVIPDHPEPHLFAQGFGGVVLALAGAALLLGLPLAGWALAWLVIALAALNLFAGLCVGCLMYYWLNRLGVPGFAAEPLPGTFPGMRPPRPE
jgi:molybdopterin converting factor small subunit